MRIDADLHLLDAQPAQLLRFAFADHDGVGFHFDVEQQPAGVGHKLQKIAGAEKTSPPLKVRKNVPAGREAGPEFL